jgi:release factor glutamine methyltransferase
MTTPLTVAELLTKGPRRLAGSPPDGALGLDVQLLMAHALGTNRTRIVAQPEYRPEEAQAQRYWELIERRAGGEPLAYILGRKEFWSLPLRVGPTVLVPRPETELLVERALALHASPSARVVDLGTGSGAIALALASERPQWEVTATDTSAEALAVARENALALGLGRIEFLLGDWLEPVGDRTFDLIVSNPPYIGADDPVLSAGTLRHEPRLALTPGADGLSSLLSIIRAASRYLERHGWLLLEHGADQGPAVARELVARGFRYVRSHRDLAGHERTTEAQRN